MRFHTEAEAEAVVDLVEAWQQIYLDNLGRRLVFAADEYYLLAGRDFPAADTYEGFAMHEDGIGMARTFELEFTGEATSAVTPAAGFFSWVDGAPAEGYRAARLASQHEGPTAAATITQTPTQTSTSTSTLNPTSAAGRAASVPVMLRTKSRPPAPDERPVGILTGAYGARVLEPMVRTLEREDVRLIPVDNRFFGGNIGVTGLMVGDDIARHLAGEPEGHRYLLPDVCLSGGVFLDGVTVDELPRPVEIVSTDGISLRTALEVVR